MSIFKLAATLGGLAACCTMAAAQELPARIKDAGEIIVGINPNYPPLEYRNTTTSELEGFDIDLGNALADKLGVKLRWEEMTFAQTTPAMTTGRIDIILSGMSDLTSRYEVMDFVDYMKSGGQFFINYADREKFANREDLCGQKVGASRRTSFPAEIEKWSKRNCEANGKSAIEVVGTEGSPDARAQLRSGRLAAALQGSETLPYLINMEPDTFAIIGEPITSVYQGIGIGKENTELRDAIAYALGELMKDGTYKTILDKWNLGNTALDKAMVNGGAELEKQQAAE